MGTVASKHFNMYKFALILVLAFIGASGKNLVRNDDNDHEFTEQELKDIINLVFCACDNDGDFQLTLDEYLGPICEAVGFYMFEHENHENDFTSGDANGDGILTVDEAFNGATNDIPTHRISAALRSAASRDFQTDVAVEAGVRVLGCACDTDGSFTVSFDEANAETCVAVQEWMTADHDGQDFLGPYFDNIDQNGDGEIDHQEATDSFHFTIGLEKDIHLVFCACDTDGDFQLSLDEFLRPVCEAVGFFMFHHENSENDFTSTDADGDGLVTPGEAFYAALNGGEVPTRRSAENLRQNFNNATMVEAGVRVLGCACDTDGSLTVSLIEAYGEECLNVQHWMTETDEEPEGHEFLGPHFEDIDQNKDGEIDAQEAADAFYYVMENGLPTMLA